MSEFVKVGKVADIAPGQGQSYMVGEKVVGVFNVDGVFHAINDLCPHAGASLSAGHLDGCVVACPWHAWRFSVVDGTWMDNTRLKVDVYDVRIEGDDLLISSSPRPDGQNQETESAG